jgi:hypothetical protein
VDSDPPTTEKATAPPNISGPARRVRQHFPNPVIEQNLPLSGCRGAPGGIFDLGARHERVTAREEGFDCRIELVDLRYPGTKAEAPADVRCSSSRIWLRDPGSLSAIQKRVLQLADQAKITSHESFDSRWRSFSNPNL